METVLVLPPLGLEHVLKFFSDSLEVHRLINDVGRIHEGGELGLLPVRVAEPLPQHLLKHRDVALYVL